MPADSKNVRVCVDYVLPPNRAIEAARLAIEENPANLAIPHLRPGLGVAASPLRLALETAKRWKAGRTMRVAFLGGHAKVREKVKEYASQWLQHANIRLDFDSSGGTEIRVAFALTGSSWSTVGTDALAVPPHQATMNYGWLTPDTPEDEFSRVIIHEFGHALGCIHEHQHPEAGIKWNVEAVYARFSGPPNNWTREEIDFNILQKYERTITQFSAFDPKSIMLYAFPPELTLDGKGTNWNTMLSDTDKSFIKTQYPPAAKSVNVLQVGEAPVEDSIGAHGEEDLFQFEVTQAGKYVIETQGRTDVVMALLGPGTLTNLVAEDDDSGVGRNARIDTTLTPGTYVVRIRHYRPSGIGKYKLSVRKA